MPRIFIFIDESGNPFENEIAFSTAAVWCAVERPEGREKPLKPTIDSLIQYLRDYGRIAWTREIHHRELPDEYSEYLLFLAIDAARSDNTILRDGTFWDGAPIMFSIATDNPCAVKAFNPEMTRQILGNRSRLNALGNLLRPLCIYDGNEDIRVDIILDAEVWKNCINKYDRRLENTINNERIHPEIYFCRSSNTPGLQIADLVAGINRRFILHSRQKIGYRLIQNNILGCIRSPYR